MTYLTYDAPPGQTPILEYYRYDVFGQPAIYGPDNQVRQASLYSNRFLFTGREYNANFGFYEYRARAYHPSLGRFMSEDPKLFDAGDYNLFRYCHNDPIDNVDPMGLDGYDTVHNFIVGFANSITFDQAERVGEFISPGYVAATDKSSTAYSLGSHLGLAAALVGGQGEGRGALRVAKDAMARGRASEARVLKELGEVKNTAKVSGKEGRSIPDFINKNAIGEIKDTKRVTDSAQLRIQREAAAAEGKEHQIITGERTSVSDNAAKGSSVIPRSDLGPQSPNNFYEQALERGINEGEHSRHTPQPEPH